MLIHPVGNPAAVDPARPAPVTAPPGVTSSRRVVRYDPAQLTELVRLVDAGVVTPDGLAGKVTIRPV